MRGAPAVAEIATAHAGYYDNLGDLAVDGVWETRYGTAGVALQPARTLFQ